MLTVGRLLERLDILSVVGTVRRKQKIGALVCDSRKAVAGCLFIAVRGLVTDGHRFIDRAVEAGASVVICEKPPSATKEDCLYLVVDDARKARALAASAFYGDPAARLSIIGVTGTNGKTTTARLMAAMFNDCGVRAGYIGTGLATVGEEAVPLERTTPEAEELHRLFKSMAERGCRAVVMEVSSHALVQDRTFGIRFSGAVFTNLTPEHLDFHLDMDRYAAAKRLLFRSLEPDGFAVLNADDPRSVFMMEALAGQRLLCCSLDGSGGTPAARGEDIRAVVSVSDMSGTRLTIRAGGRSHEAFFRLPGRYNVMNLLEVFAAGLGMGIPAERVLAALGNVSPVEGRMEVVGEGAKGGRAIVDYAHTPDALEKVLEALDELKPEGGSLIVVFGCGGNRDREKRPEMGRIASARAKRVIVTSDNPRDEDPERIMDEIVAGIRSAGYLRFSDRAEAIRCGVNLMHPEDVLLVAGKGHEKYQEKSGARTYFSDQETARAALLARERVC
ncbi:UDP-N-acetylmuramoyl-L-alanyl-D-glutamate--2,6-diaminopimelate ligase [Prosthecochloris sp. GSB1]|uniref:UDP-N-acetylmuramoyl-L-alanyl-D-glutamate--2, 6-diaminopimelate ligase n=1 Tax=Prosthecochloris sp. GSB1 TaxID=281093 RepID=UPI000B8C86AE|nr:UDP-N-acetylmuramoyl-L-alanyl-D-glutamate--2,6-diaminopimelate ligase [Prosthecochloris sp. GSB1]ASQ91505.1 UDP-N-acetylmuramoyl-L-alanyl-D-glutamate--2,6-diaminopimelate ligase [Prosthecochloris sp. GSB1]